MRYALWISETGSLISSYTDSSGAIRLKSKGSINSEQVFAAEKLLYSPEYKNLFNITRYFESIDLTVNFEYTAPDNRIVIGYQNPELRILNLRCRCTDIVDNTIYLMSKQTVDLNDNINSEFIKKFVVDEYDLSKETIDSLFDDKVGIEGYVVVLDTPKGQLMVKIKTPWYLALHRTKDTINNDKDLVAAIINEASDDLKSLFKDDAVAMNKILATENIVMPKYNSMVSTIEKYVEDNEHLDRKTFAIQTKERFNLWFGMIMAKYLGKEPKYKEYAIDNYKAFLTNG